MTQLQFSRLNNLIIAWYYITMCEGELFAHHRELKTRESLHDTLSAVFNQKNHVRKCFLNLMESSQIQFS